MDDLFAPAAIAALPGVAEAAAEVARALQQVTVRVRSGGKGGGSGVVWFPEGVIVTNAHVVRAERATVELADGRRFAARLRARNPERDLAALDLEAADLPLPTAPVADPRRVRTGDLVVAVGNPLGYAGALSLGIVHAVEPVRAGAAPRWIRTTARLAPGNSGGPLADSQGRILGINTLIHRGLGVAVPSTAIERFLLPADARPELGVVVQPVGIRRRNEVTPGWLVLQVKRGGAAAAAGLLPGDVLTGAGGEPFGSPTDLDALLEGVPAAGGAVRVGVLRAGRVCTLELHLAAASRRPRAA